MHSTKLALTELNHVVRLSDQDSGLHLSIARFNNSLLDSKRLHPDKFFRREPVVIVNTLNSQRVIRYAMGNAGKYSIKKSAIGLDYDAVDALGVRFKEICQLQARKATQWEVLVWFWNHKDLPTQLSIRLGVLGLMLGLIGFLSSLLPMLLS